MSTISSYILRQTMGPLLAAVAVALLVLLTERMLRLLDMVLDTGSGLTLLLQMLAFLVPHYMALALPVAFFLGVLLAFSRLHQNRELDALGSAGIGLRRRRLHWLRHPWTAHAEQPWPIDPEAFRRFNLIRRHGGVFLAVATPSPQGPSGWKSASRASSMFSRHRSIRRRPTPE